MDFEDAEEVCATQFGTNLASIHSDSDQAMASTLCQFMGLDCWIGMLGLEWTDNLEFVYGSSVDGTFPWNDDEPDDNAYNDSLCAFIEDGDSLWETATCDLQKIPLCNMPSEICIESQWITIGSNATNSTMNSTTNTSTDSNIHFQHSPCSMTIDGDSIMMIANKQWETELDVSMTIEFTFTISDSNSVSGGVLIGTATNISETVDVNQSYFVGIDALRSTLFFSIHTLHSNGSYIIDTIYETNLYFEYIPGTFHTLTIELTPESHSGTISWVIWVDDAIYLPFEYDDESLRNGNAHSNADSNADSLWTMIGIRSVTSNLSARSLFVSGDFQYVNIDENEPVITTTNDNGLNDEYTANISNPNAPSTPTTATTTTIWTPTPIDSGTRYVVFISVVILYFESNDISPSQNNIDILRNITRQSINTLITGLEAEHGRIVSDCNSLHNYTLNATIDQLYQNEEKSYNALDLSTNIPVCYPSLQSLIELSLDMSLQSNLENTIELTIIDLSDVFVDTESLSLSITTPTTTTINMMTTSSPGDGGQVKVSASQSMEAALLIIGGLAVAVICLICIFCILVYSKVSRLQAKANSDLDGLSNTVNNRNRNDIKLPLGMGITSSSTPHQPSYIIDHSLASTQVKLKKPGMSALNLQVSSNASQVSDGSYLDTPSESDEIVTSETMSRLNRSDRTLVGSVGTDKRQSFNIVINNRPSAPTVSASRNHLVPGPRSSTRPRQQPERESRSRSRSRSDQKRRSERFPVDTRGMQITKELKELTRRMSSFNKRLSQVQDTELKIARDLQMMEVRRKQEDEEYGKNSNRRMSSESDKATEEEGCSQEVGSTNQQNSENIASAAQEQREHNHNQQNQGRLPLHDYVSERSQSPPEPRELREQSTSPEQSSSPDHSSRSTSPSKPSSQYRQRATFAATIPEEPSESSEPGSTRSSQLMGHTVIPHSVNTFSSYTHSSVNGPNPRRSMMPVTRQSRPPLTIKHQAESLKVDIGSRKLKKLASKSEVAARSKSDILKGVPQIEQPLTLRPQNTEIARGREELRDWLTECVGLVMYYNTFVTNGYESIRFMKDIQSEGELQELGIQLRGHRRRIWAEIQKLRTSKEMDRMKQEDEEKMMEEVSEPELENGNSNTTTSRPSIPRPSALGFTLTDSTHNVIMGYTDNHLDLPRNGIDTPSNSSTRGGHEQWNSVRL